MAEEPQTKPETTQPHTSHWWQTMPAVMGGVATMLTAVTGLVVALKPSEPPQTSTPAVTPAAAQTQAPAQNSVQPVQAQPLQAQPNAVQPVQQQIIPSSSSPVDANYTTSNGDEKRFKKKGKGKGKKDD